MEWLERRVPPPIVAALCATLMWWIAQHTTRITPPDDAVRIVAVLSAALAGILFIAAIGGFAVAKTTVSPTRRAEPSALVTTGVYRYTRNPMYLALACLLHGWATWLRAPVALVGLVLFVAYITRFQIAAEERALMTRFGAAYASYRASAGRWL
jgi:protein-S-isoprenylcysteine O-methyltransferase Ste14